jgi:hypothetical protein
MTSYLLAARNGDWETMQSYLNTDENLKYSVDETSKKIAAVLLIENNHIEVLRAMLHRGAAVTYRPAPHREPWFNKFASTESLGSIATRLGNIDAVKALAVVDQQLFGTWRFDTILVVAARHNQHDMVEWLMDVAYMAPGQHLFLDVVDIGHLPLARWMMSTGRAGIDEFTAVMRAASDRRWKLLSILLEICDPDFTSADHRGKTFWDIVDWRALVIIHADNVDEIAFMAALRKKVVVPENVTRLMRNANMYTSENYLRAAREANWSHMSGCLDEDFPLRKSVDSDSKSAAMLIIDSGIHLSLLTRLDGRSALFHSDGYPGASRNATMRKLCIYVADTMNLDSIRKLIGMGGDKLVEYLVRYIAHFGGLEIM